MEYLLYILKPGALQFFDNEFKETEVSDASNKMGLMVVVENVKPFLCLIKESYF